MSAEQLDDLPLAVEAYALALAHRDVELKRMALEIEHLTEENAALREQYEAR